ncbi:MAG: general secretion pathway protein GspK [Luteolibacter sp.]
MRTAARHHPRAAALLAVIWLIAILAIATMSALRVISFDVEVASSKIHGSRARQLAEMGIAVGANPAVMRSDPLLRQFDDQAGEGFQVRLVSEGGRFNLNAILLQEDESLLLSIFTYWGLELDEAQEIIDALADWVDADEETRLNGAEIEFYEGLGRINQPFNRPFYDIDEARLVRGMDRVETLRPDWRNWFTIWSSGALDLNEATAELIAAAAEISPEEAAILPELVTGMDGIRDTEDDEPFENPASALDLLGIDAEARPDLARRFTVDDAVTRIESTGMAAGAKRRITVIVRNRAGRPALLERTEEIVP